jgi:hypothetical protein
MSLRWRGAVICRDRGTCHLRLQARIDFLSIVHKSVSQSTFSATFNMLSLIAGPIAGPSRLRCFTRSVHITPFAYAPPKRRARVTTPTLPSSPIPTRSPTPRQSPIPTQSQAKTPQTPITPQTTHITPPLAATWNWKPLPNPSGDVVEEERTIFARPFEVGRPRMYWFGFLVSGLFFTTWLTFPPSARSLAPSDGET